MTIHELSNQDLLKKTEELAKKEKVLTLILLRHLYEINRRRIYGLLGYGSIYDYCVKQLKYTKCEAYLRLKAMRLMQGSEVIEKAIGDGRLSLSNAAQVQETIKALEAKNGDELNIKQKEAIVEKIFDLPTRDAQTILEKLKGGAFPRKIRIEVDVETYGKFEKFREMKGHYSDQEIINISIDEKLMNLEVEKNKLLEKIRSQQVSKEKINDGVPGKALGKKQTPGHDSRHIPTEVRSKLMERSGGQCEYCSPINGERCQEKRDLQIDHIRPYGECALTDYENLRVYCRSHNQMAAIQYYGQQKMDQYINKK